MWLTPALNAIKNRWSRNENYNQSNFGHKEVRHKSDQLTREYKIFIEIPQSLNFCYKRVQTERARVGRERVSSASRM